MMAEFVEFLSMDGRGVYVWSAYGVFVVVLVFNIVMPVLRRRRVLREIARRARRERGKANASAT